VHEDIRRRVVDRDRATQLDASHPLLGAVVAIEITRLQTVGDRLTVWSDVFVHIPPVLDPGLENTVWENFSWGGASARQLKRLEVGEVLLARVMGTWMEAHGTTRITLDPNLSDSEREALLLAWERVGDDN